MDTGIKGQAVDDSGVLVSTKPGQWGAQCVSVYNAGSDYVYAKVNSTAAAVVAAITAGSGAIPIASGASFEWNGFNIVNVCLACDSGETATVDVGAYTF